MENGNNERITKEYKILKIWNLLNMVLVRSKNEKLEGQTDINQRI